MACIVFEYSASRIVSLIVSVSSHSGHISTAICNVAAHSDVSFFFPFTFCFVWPSEFKSSIILILLRQRRLVALFFGNHLGIRGISDRQPKPPCIYTKATGLFGSHLQPLDALLLEGYGYSSIGIYTCGMLFCVCAHRTVSIEYLFQIYNVDTKKMVLATEWVRSP